jgi:t-SNARE complex subunit (syntaxin)
MSNDPMIVNAKRQEDFDKVLISRTAQIEKLVRQFDMQLGKLGKDWQDVQFEEFRRQAISMRRTIEKFTAESRKVSGNLKQSIKLAEDYSKIKEG